MSAKERYIQFCTSYHVSLFFKPSWLDICHHSWDVVESEIEGFNAYWVYHLERKMGLRFIRNPHLTPYTGLIFCDRNTPLEIKQKLSSSLINQLPKFDVMELDLDMIIPHEIESPSISKSFRRTNILSLENIVTLYSQFKPSLQRQIKKAQKSLHIVEANDINQFYQLHEKTFLKQSKKPSISFEIYNEYWNSSMENNSGRLFFILDSNKQVHASIWLAFDSTTAYYLAGGTDHAYYGSGAMSLLMWHVIQESAKMGLSQFDFEGSMLPSIDRFFKNFNPEEKNYVHLSKVNSLLYKIVKS